MSASNAVFLLVWGHVWGLLVVFLLTVVLVMVVLIRRILPPDHSGLRLQGSSSLTRDRRCGGDEVPAQRAASSRLVHGDDGVVLTGSSFVQSEIKPPAGVPCLSGFLDIHTFRVRILDDEIESQILGLDDA